MQPAIQHSTQVLYLGIELAVKHWKLAFRYQGRKRIVMIRSGHPGDLQSEIRKAKLKLDIAETTPVYSCYEAGRDGFWVHHFLEDQGIRSVIVDPASIQVNRRKRRRKTDRIDAEKLVRHLVRHWREDDSADWRVVRVPTTEQEDQRRKTRELERLKKERTGHRARLKSLAALHGIQLRHPLGDVDKLRDWQGKKLPAEIRDEMAREQQRLKLVNEQIADIDRERHQRLQEPTSDAEKMTVDLMKVRGIGLEGGWTLSTDFFWRDFENTKQVASAAGLAPTPYNTGQSEREQGISKAGSGRIRSLMIQLAWGWVRMQPDSKITKWFNRRFAHGSKRTRRIGITAVARKLLVALWKYVQTGEVPEGAVLSSS